MFKSLKNEEEKILKQSEEYAIKKNFKLNLNKKIVNSVIKGLLANEKKYGARYCPCKLITGNKKKDKNIICPCKDHKIEIKKYGRCKCGLFVK